MNIKKWKDIDWDNCPECGDAMEVFTDAPMDLVGDAEEVRCLNCDWRGYTSVDESGATIYESIPANQEPIPEWIIKYDQANHQSSAGRAIRYLLERLKQ